MRGCDGDAMNVIKQIAIGLTLWAVMVAFVAAVLTLSVGYALQVSANVVTMRSDSLYVGLACTNGADFKLIDNSLGFSCS